MSKVQERITELKEILNKEREKAKEKRVSLSMKYWAAFSRYKGFKEALKLKDEELKEKIDDLKSFVIKEWDVNYRPARIIMDKIDEIFSEEKPNE